MQNPASHFEADTHLASLHARPVIDESPCNQPALVAARQPGKRKQFQAKETLYREGEQVGSVYLIRSGMVKLLSYLPNGRVRIVRLHGRAHCLGLEGLLRLPFEHTAVAVHDVEVEYFPIQRLRRLQGEDPAKFTELLYQWHLYLRQADKWIAEFSTGEIKPRVARLLHFLASFEQEEEQFGTFGLLTVEEIAEILGVTPESVSRHLAEFKRTSVLRRDAGTTPKNYRIDTDRVAQEAYR